MAPRLRALAIVTGEVVGQVASQTLENLAATEAAASLPVLRPLIGLDKDEIVAEAARIGTFETSILPDEDCCQLLSPRHPATRARSIDLDRVEAALPLAALIEAAVAAATTERYGTSGAAPLTCGYSLPA